MCVAGYRKGKDLEKGVLGKRIPECRVPVFGSRVSCLGFGGWGSVFYYYGEVPRGEKMLYAGTDPESYTAKNTIVY